MTDTVDIIKAALCEGGRSLAYVETHTGEDGYDAWAFTDDEAWRAREIANHATPVCRRCFDLSRPLCRSEAAKSLMDTCLAQERLVPNCYRPDLMP